MTCGDCKFFNQTETECRRYAPQPSANDTRAQWPSVSETEWCGEFVDATAPDLKKAA
ncbi:MAG: hypothetical protein AAGG45_07540 [Pseudomonadota bacterium]